MPTDKELHDACDKVQVYLNAFRFNPHAVPIADEKEAMKTLISVARPQRTNDPRPFDMPELARLTAQELRDRGIWADDEGAAVSVPGCTKALTYYSMHAADFDNLGPRGCADVIQQEERRRAREWAGDE